MLHSKNIMLPHTGTIEDINILYPLIEPYAYANIKWDSAAKEIVYNIIEPALTPHEEELLKRISSDLMELIDVELSSIKNPEEAMKYLEGQIKKILEESGTRPKRHEYSKIIYYVYRNFVGLNRIEPMMHDAFIEDISCDGINTPFYIIHQRFGSIKTNVKFVDIDELRDFVIKLSERCGRYISYAEPLLDGTLPDGSRVQSSLAGDVTTHGPTFTIRKFRSEPFTPIDMVGLGTASTEMLAYLWLCMEHGASLLIAGGVATGKTTMLNCLSMFIPMEDKIISIEDTRELNLPHENWIPMVTRVGFGLPTPTGDKYGEVTLFDLLKESFRQNPDYVIVGEVRGKEAYVMFQGMSSGHPSIGTIHSDSVEGVIRRLTTPPIELSASLLEALDIVMVMIHPREKGKSARRVKEIDEIESVDAYTNKPHVAKPFVWEPRSDVYEFSGNSWFFQRLAMEKGLQQGYLNEEMSTRKRVLDWMARKRIKKLEDVANMIHLYYRDRQTIVKWVDDDADPYSTRSRDDVMRSRFTAGGMRIVEEK